MTVKLLIAASPEICAAGWMQDHINAVLGHAEIEVWTFGRHRILAKVLQTIGVEPLPVVVSGKVSRRDVRDTVAECDFLLLFWNGIDHTNLLFEARLQGKKTKVIPFETTTVVNRDREEFDVYIGRGSPWGNPYPVGSQDGQYTREEAIELYGRDFQKKLATEPDFKKGLNGLRGYRLGCFCKPLACHGDVLAGYLNGLSPDEPRKSV